MRDDDSSNVLDVVRRADADGADAADRPGSKSSQSLRARNDVGVGFVVGQDELGARVR